MDALHTKQPFTFQRIHFVPATEPDAHSVALPAGLEPLNKPMRTKLRGRSTARERSSGEASTSQKVKEIFPEERVPSKWRKARSVGVGLINLGNTCFMNSVLQVLTHTPQLAELCLGEARLGTDCVSEGLQSHVDRALSGKHRNGIAPRNMVACLKRVNRSFRVGRQEDAHEYLRCLLDYIHEASLAPFKPKPPMAVQTTTLVHRVFGGRLRNQVECTDVKYESSVYEPFLDLSLHINRAKNLQSALSHFTAKEVLDGDNKYRCPLNNKLVRAVKTCTIQEPPNVLTIHFKRFEFSMLGRKLMRHVEFPVELDLSPWLHHTAARGNHWYDLVGVVVHHGHSVHSGHYVAYVRAVGIWYVCDDARVARVAERAVLGQKAYILMYARREPRTWLLPKSVSPANVLQERSSNIPADAAPRGAAGRRNGRGGAERNNGAAVPAELSVRVAEQAVDRDDEGADRPGAVNGPDEPSAAGDSPKKVLRSGKRVGRRKSVVPVLMAINASGRSQRGMVLCQSQRHRPSSRSSARGALPEPDTPEASAPERERRQRGVLPAAQPATSTVPQAGGQTEAEPRAAPRDAAAKPPGGKLPVDTSPEAVGNLLRGSGRRLLPVGRWSDVDADVAKQADKLLRRDQPKRKAPDAYDLEYDRGKVKKVKRKRTDENGVPAAGPSSNQFQAKFEAQQRAHAAGGQQARRNGVRSEGSNAASGSVQKAGRGKRGPTKGRNRRR